MIDDWPDKDTSHLPQPPSSFSRERSTPNIFERIEMAIAWMRRRIARRGASTS